MTHDPRCPANRPHFSSLCQHDKASTCGVCVHECLCDLIALVRAEEQLNATNQRINDFGERIEYLRQKLTNN